MPALKPEALPVETDTPAHRRDHGPVLLSLAALTILQSRPRAQANGEAPVRHQPTESALQAPAWAGLGSGCRHAALAAPGSPAALRDWHRPRSHKLQGDVFSVGQKSAHDVSHESDGKGGSGVT